ncbi:hypothetical protein JOE51_005418 [Bradyrhizobium japonicum]|uniref:Uncharacterized protein n=1 Tax=Bradyrhizobium diazoefficiens TaxID=1355477 RepID=A0A809XY49_9BRAD|nr:hypothetical protein [Bradyrhizobium diazoefficiens]MBP1063951.1 hypothetical protein [Bradyrhizobium japonicum]BCA05652.1 hypothetical protein H12S4_65560 [Bradyrhizobium diazoefficiens]BCA23006.1 hypothetical protein BDHH15_62210 [Bradyrhizobium diazoefficiens]BCE32379.1 hypothetical protein XF2B_61480 [Bradyrhizobium diazoefficiens]BCE41164.1 hypothetical protein XF3B_61950 [Bradyrhizobium diazoefficiens]
MNATSEQAGPAPDDLGATADQAIEACGGDPREAVKALLIALDFLEAEANELRAAVSKGYSRGRHGPQRERKE